MAMVDRALGGSKARKLRTVLPERALKGEKAVVTPVRYLVNMMLTLPLCPPVVGVDRGWTEQSAASLGEAKPSLGGRRRCLVTLVPDLHVRAELVPPADLLSARIRAKSHLVCLHHQRDGRRMQHLGV